MLNRNFLISGIAAIFMAAVSCSCASEDEILVAGCFVSPDASQDPFQLNSATIIGDALLLEVEYGGGCTEHEFMLTWPDAIIAVHPYEFDIILSHNANDDECEAYITDTVTIDIANNPLQLTSGSLIGSKITVINSTNSENKVLVGFEI